MLDRICFLSKDLYIPFIHLYIIFDTLDFISKMKFVKVFDLEIFSWKLNKNLKNLPNLLEIIILMLMLSLKYPDTVYSFLWEQRLIRTKERERERKRNRFLFTDFAPEMPGGRESSLTNLLTTNISRPSLLQDKVNTALDTGERHFQSQWPHESLEDWSSIMKGNYVILFPCQLRQMRKIWKITTSMIIMLENILA